MTIKVSLDSSVLYSFGVAFNRLQSLVSEKIVKVYVSEVVQKEVSLHLRAEFNEKINQSELGLTKILKHRWLQDIGDRTVLENAHNIISQAKENIEKISEKGVDDIWKSIQAEVLAVQPHHGASVTTSYFSGILPFKKVKSREDFPDAFIFETAKDLRVLLDDANIHFVVADGTLRDSVSKIPGVIVHKSLDEFVQCEDVENLARQNEIEKHWNEIYDRMLPKLPSLADIFTTSIQAITYELAWRKLYHPFIPDDNNEAIISVIKEPDSVIFTWEDVRNYGQGLITIPFEFETIAEIQFSVYRGEAYHLDDKIYVENGDPETDHYFDAGGSVRIIVSGAISVQFDDKEIEAEEMFGTLREIQFSKIYNIEIMEDEQGNIFI